MIFKILYLKISIREEIKKDVKEKRDKIRLQGRAIVWLLRPSKQNRYRERNER